MSEDSKIFQATGDPFVDAGAWILAVLNDKSHPHELVVADFRSKLEFLANILTKDSWEKLLYSIFPNNKITNPSIKKEFKKETYLNFLKDLFDNISFLKGHGSCLACGKRNISSLKTKDVIPLIGSKKLINFFSAGEKGAQYCDTCSLLVQFSPLMLYKARQLVLLQSTSNHVLKYWTLKIRDFINNQITMGDYSGCWNTGITQPINSLFDFATNLIREYDTNWFEESPTITIYHFTNYIQRPDLEIFNLPSDVFRFLTYIHSHNERDVWYRIVKKGFFRLKSNAQDKDVARAFKKYTNRVYINLLNNRSIVHYFIDTKNRKCEGSWDLFEYYLTTVKKMDKKRIENIKKLGDEISEFIRQTNQIKRLTQLELAKNYFSFRNILRIISKTRLSLNPKEPLFTLDNYVQYLFPEGALSWTETRDLLLFRIYEQLHDYLVENVKEISEESEKMEIEI